MAEMNFERASMATLFTGKDTLAVPAYQRGYDWSEEQWEDFWNDLNEVLDENEDDHFFGQIVTNRLSSDEKDFIVDGQQRITTSTIFLAILRDQFENTNTERGKIRAHDLQKKFVGKNGKYKFNQIDQINTFFEHLIQNHAFNFNEVKKEAKQQNEKNFVKAYEYLNKKVESELKKKNTSDERLEYIEELQDTFLDNTFVMKISTPDEASAFVIFETLNARGRDLNSSDLLKNHLFRKSEGSEEIQELWENMITPLDHKSELTTKFIRSYWNGTHDFTTEKKLYRALSRSIDTNRDAIKLVTKLANLSDYFAAIIDPAKNTSFNDNTLINNLTILKLLGAKTFYPLLLVMIDKKYTEEDIAKVLYTIITFTVRNFTIGGLVANKFEKLFAQVARKVNEDTITTVDEINHLISKEMIDDQKFIESFSTAELSTEKVSKYILSEVAYQEDYNKINLDDIKVVYINENVDNKNRIGNKLIVTKAEYKSINKSHNKQQTIEKSKFETNHLLAPLVNNITDDQINQRQKSWEQTALQIWHKK